MSILSNFRTEGEKAQTEGKHVTSNPYSAETRAHRAWLDGFVGACMFAPKVDLTKTPAVQTGMIPATLNELDLARIDALPLRTNKKVDLRKKVDLTKRPFAAPLPIDSRTNAQIMEAARARIAAFRASPIPLRTEMTATDYLSRVAIQTAMADTL